MILGSGLKALAQIQARKIKLGQIFLRPFWL